MVNNEKINTYIKIGVHDNITIMTAKNEFGSRKSWLATINNYTDADVELFKSWGNDVTRITACVETAPTTGTQHLHVKVTFRKTKRLAALKKLHDRANWCSMAVDHDEALYCKKSDSIQLFDIDNRKQGERSDLETAIAELKTGASLRDLWTKHTGVMIRYHRGISLAAKELAPIVQYPRYKLTDFPKWTPITDWSTSHIICGPPNIGKTEFAKAHFPDGFLFVSHIDELENFNASSHTGIVFDDISFKHMPRTAQIHITDIDNPRAIHIRYGTAAIPAFTRKIFTCNPEDIPFNLFDIAISRRVTVTEVRER